MFFYTYVVTELFKHCNTIVAAQTTCIEQKHKMQLSIILNGILDTKEELRR